MYENLFFILTLDDAKLQDLAYNPSSVPLR